VRLVERLAAICGGDHARPAGTADTVAGVPAGAVAAPGSVQAAAEVLGFAAAEGLAVVPRGAGTKIDWAAAPARVDVILDTGRLAGVHYHAVGDQVATVGAGTPLRAVQASLGSAAQRIAVDIASRSATVGGVLAVNEAGPLRLTYGTPRDLVIGVQFVRADGVVVHAGGRAVRNLAGYDLGRLLCGSYGTLGVLTSATFRLHPRPAARSWIVRTVRSPLEVHELTAALAASVLAPTAVEADLPAEAPGPVPRQRGLARRTWQGSVAVLLEGAPAGVTARAAAVATLLGGDATPVETPPDWWGRYPFGPHDVAVKLSVPAADLHAALYALRDAAGAAAPVRGSVAAGVVHAALPGTWSPDRVRAVLDAMRMTLASRGGFCTVLHAPPEIRRVVDMWGPVPGLSLMRRVKEQFDPGRALAPGRMAGGL
jgi:glycolate oxidase FAD binding subunit